MLGALEMTAAIRSESIDDLHSTGAIVARYGSTWCIERFACGIATVMADYRFNDNSGYLQSLSSLHESCIRVHCTFVEG